MRYLTLPNLLTTARAVFAPYIPISLFFGYNPFWRIWDTDHRLAALVLAIGLAFTDILDGAFARWLKQETALGKQLDPFADCVFCVSLFLAALVIYGQTPVVLLWIAFGAHFIWYAWSVTRLRAAGHIDKPNKYAKASMCILMLSLLLVIPSSFSPAVAKISSWQDIINDLLAIFGVMLSVRLADLSLDAYKTPSLEQVAWPKNKIRPVPTHPPIP